MSDLSIRVGDLHFSARWEPEAPRTIEAIRRMLPLRAEAHPLPLERRVDLDPVRRLPARARLREPHLAPGARPARALPGRHQRVRDLLPVRRAARRRRRSASSRRTTSPRSCRTTAGTTGCARSAGAASGRAPRTIEIVELRLSAGPMTDLLVRGGTVVTRVGLARGRRRRRRRADRGDRARPLRARPPRRDEVVDATGLLVLPGVDRRPHPHPGRVATPSPTGSSRTPSRRRSAARRRSSRSTTPGPARRRRRSDRSWPGSPSGARRRPPTRPSTSR